VAAGYGVYFDSGRCTCFSCWHRRAILRKKVNRSLVSEFGFAFLIAFVLHASLEFHSRMERERQVSRGIIAYLYGMNLDDDIFKLTEKHVFEAPFYRRSLDLEFDFLKSEGDNVLIKQTVSFMVENISRDKRDYKIRTFVEKPAGDCGRVFSATSSVGLQRISVDGVKISEQDLREAKNKLPDTPDFYVSGYHITMAPGETKMVEIVSLIENVLPTRKCGELSCHPPGLIYELGGATLFT
jgi:hypothetical protein